ncbi:MAG: hypothetical protein HY801_16345 [Candidatus Lindowbacteria bacterium]|nr:hypothetical protein [Candidatus Lindowbacteria bacterium]
MTVIKGYSFGVVSVDGSKYERDIIIYPDRIQSDWWRREGHKLQIEDIGDVLANPPEVFVVGLGDQARMQVDPRVAEELKKRGVELFAAPTKQACDKFNKLAEEGKRVIAALHLTC